MKTLENVTLYNADCFDILPTIPDDSVDMVLTSPPYDNLRDYGGIAESFTFEKFQVLAKELFRVLKQGGVIIWIVNDQTVNGSETGTSFRQALYFKEIGFNIHDTMIWNKMGFTATGSLQCRYAPVFEYMFVFSKGKPKTFNALKDHANRNFGRKYHGTIRQKDGQTKPMNSAGKICAEFGQRWNVWNIFPALSNIERTGHPAQFPLDLAKDHIYSWSNEGDLVLDPFMGSGTTGAACAELKRKFIGIEINPEYFAIAEKRIQTAVDNYQHKFDFAEY